MVPNQIPWNSGGMFPCQNPEDSVTELSVDEASITSPKKIAESLNNQFQRVFPTPDRDPLPNQPKYTVDKPMSPITVSKDNIEARLKNLNQNKSVGPDGIHLWTLKEAHAELALPLRTLFQKSLDTKILLQDWWNATITLSKSNPAFYHPISITSIVGKVLEGIVNTAIVRHLTSNNLIMQSQHGFRSGQSIDTNGCVQFCWF